MERNFTAEQMVGLLDVERAYRDEAEQEASRARQKEQDSHNQRGNERDKVRLLADYLQDVHGEGLDEVIEWALRQRTPSGEQRPLTSSSLKREALPKPWDEGRWL